MSILKHKAFLPTITGLLGVAAGLTGGYILGKKSGESGEGLLDVVEDLAGLPLDEETAEVISFDRPTRLTFTEEQLREAPRSCSQDVVEEYEPGEIAELVAEEYAAANPNHKLHNIFKKRKDEWDYAEETPNRGNRDAYVIHYDEFHGEESGFRQSALTYYAGDDIMVDEDSDVVPNYKDTVGDLKWGHGSHDENMVYVRNPRLEAEYEIDRSYDSYLHAVLGYEAEAEADAADLKHSQQPMRFRSSKER